MDIELTCKSCGKKFVFSEGEIKYYKENELLPPRKCKYCRKNPYSDIHKELSKLGMSSQDIENNPANQSGYHPIGISKEQGFSLNHCMLTVEINNRWYYVRIERYHQDDFIVLFLTSDERATIYPPNFDLQYLLNILKARSEIEGHAFKIQRYQVQYCPHILGYKEDVELLKRLRHNVSWSSIFVAQIKYKEEWQKHYWNRYSINLEEI